MLTKSNVIKTISTFPDNFTLDELVEKLIFIDKVERGLEQSLANNVFSEEEAQKNILTVHHHARLLKISAVSGSKKT